MLKPFSGLVLGLVLICAGSTAMAQERGYPVLNSVGRFWGVGYTQGGYHAGVNGQLQIVKRNHAACQYGSNALLYPYHAGYSSSIPVDHSNATQPNLNYQPFQSPNAAPHLSPVPVGPTPQWLKPYLQENGTGRESSGAGELLAPPIGTPKPDNSGTESSRKGASGAEPFYFDRDTETSPSDNLLDEGSNDQLLDDDSLLWLESEGSFPEPFSRHSPQTTQRRPIAPTVNRYNQASSEQGPTR